MSLGLVIHRLIDFACHVLFQFHVSCWSLGIAVQCLAL